MTFSRIHSRRELTLHTWVKDRRGQKPVLEGSFKNEEGDWYKCTNCNAEIFYPDGTSDFARSILLILAFTDLAISISRSRKLEFYDHAHFQKMYGETEKVGAHALMAKYCEIYRMALIDETMAS